MKKFLVILIILGSLSFDLSAQKKDAEDVKSQINRLWFSNNSFKASRILKGIEKQNPDFDSLKSIIENRIIFSDDVSKGFTEWEYRIDSLNYYCILFVPKKYNPEKKYPVTFILHGAIANTNPKSVNTYITSSTYNTDSLDRIVVYPASWIQSPWWDDKQVKNLDYLIHRLKQAYNIDDNRIHLAGISDGGSGCYYLANKNITPWTSIRPYIGNPIIPAEYGNQTIFLKNYTNKPFFIVNTDLDHLYPAKEITPYINQIKRTGANVRYFVMSGFDHNLNWQPLLEDTLKNFIKTTIRNPYPSQLYWQTNDVKNYGRNHWVIINKLNSIENFTGINSMDELLVPFGKNNNRPSGYIIVNAIGNTIDVETNNIKEYTLLLSPYQFDFNKPIIVNTNKTLSFNGKIEKQVNVLLKWLSTDLDRTMLFGYELKIKVQ